MAESQIELIVNAVKALNPLKKVEQSTRKVEKAVEDVNKDLDKQSSKFNQAGKSAAKASSSFDNLAKNAGKLAAAYFTFNAAQNALREGINRIESERRIESLAKSYGEVAQLQDAATQSAKKFGLGQTEANKALGDIFARLRPIGVGLSDIVSVYSGFNTAARLSGTTAQEASSAFRQLSQALGSGALRGDEFNSISEQIPAILTAISQETGIAQGDLREYAAEGNITADIVIRALKRIETEGAAKLQNALDGPRQAIVDFQNATEDVQVALTRDIVPQMAEVFRGLAELIINLEGPIRFIGGVAADTLNQINSLIVQATQPAAVAARRDIEAGLIPTNIVAGLTGGDVRGGAKQLFGEAGLKELEDRAREFSDLRGVGFQETLLQFMQDRLATMDAANAPTASELSLPKLKLKPPKPPSEDSGNGPVDMSERMLQLRQQLGEAEDRNQDRIAATLKLMIERQRIAESEVKPRQRIFELEEAQRNFKNEILGIDQNIAEEARKKEEADNKVLLPLQRQAELLQARLDGTEEEVQMRHDVEDLLNKTNNLTEEGATLLLNKIELLKTENAEVDRLKANFEQIGAVIKTGMVDGIMAAIEGAQSFSESLSGILMQLARMFIQTGVSQAGQALKIPGFADGGNPPVGKMSVVGEKGPELFVPKTAGTIIPNHAIGSSNIVVNVDASGSSVEGDEQQSRQLGKLIGAAVQSEIIKQKMPGGLLS